MLKKTISFFLVVALFTSWTSPLLADPPVNSPNTPPPLPPGIVIGENLPADHPLAAFQEGLPNAIPAFQDVYRTTDQYIIDWEGDSPRSYSIHDPRIPEFQHYVANPAEQVKVAYNIERQELHFEYYAQDKSGSINRIRSHVITGVALNNIDPSLVDADGMLRKLPQIYRDANHILWTDDKGVNTVHTNFLKLLFGKKPVFVMNLLPPIQAVEKGSKFIGIEPFKLTLEPRPIFDLTTGSLVEEVDALRTLLFNVQKPNGQIESYAIHYSALSSLFRDHLNMLLGLLFTVNPDPKVAEETILILKESRLAENAQDQAALMKVIELMESNGAEKNLITHVLRKVSLDPDVAELIRKYNEKPINGGRSSSQELTLTHSPLRVNVVDPNALNSWAKGYEAATQSTPATTESWDEVVTTNMQKHAANPKETLNKLAEVQDKIETVKEKSRWNRINKIITSAMNHKAAKVVFNTKFLVIAGAITLEAINHFTHGAVGAATASFLVNAQTALSSTPVLSDVADVFARSADVFKKPYAYVAMGAWFVTLNLIVPISYAIGGKIAQAKKESIDGVTAFFKYGSRLFSKWNYPPQKLVWEYCLGQRQIYKALEDGVPLTSKGVIQTPFRAFTHGLVEYVKSFLGFVDKSDTPTVAAKESYRRAKEAYENEKVKMDQEYDSSLQKHLDRQSRSLLLASALVTLQKGQEIDLVTLHQAFLKEKAGVSVGSFLNNIETELPAETWKTLQLAAYRELKEIDTMGAEAIDLETFVTCFNNLQETAKKIKTQLESKAANSISANPYKRAKVWISNAAQASKVMFTESVWVWLFFGHQGYKFHKKYKYLEADPRNVHSAKEQYDVDYSASLVWTLIADAKNSVALLKLFSGDITGALSSMARQGALQTEQAIFYGLKSLIDQEMANPTNGKLQDPNKHPLDALNSKFGVKTEGFARSLQILCREFIDPNSKRSISMTSINRMSAITQGVAANFWAGFLPKFILNPFVMGFSFSAGIAGYFMNSFAAAPQQMIALFNKLCIGYAAISGSILVGYVAIWPFVLHWMNVAKDEAARNQSLLKNLSEKIWNAAQSGDGPESVRKEIEASLLLYDENKKDISFLNKNISTMSPDDMEKLAITLRVDPPIANKASTVLIASVNLLGAVVSSVLAVGLFDHLFADGVNFLHLAIDTAIALTGTWLGTKYFVKPVVDYVLGFRKGISLPSDPDDPRYPTRKTQKALKTLRGSSAGCKGLLGASTN